MLNKITFSKLFVVITMILLITTGLFYLFFTKTKENIVTNFERTGVKEVEEITRNIEEYLLSTHTTDTLYEALKENPKKRVEWEAFLSTFQTSKIQDIFIVDKPDKSTFLFRVLLDGSKEKEGKFHFGELFEPEDEFWNEIRVTKKPKVLYQANHVNALWVTFLYPIVQHNGDVAILALDFSKKHYQHVVSSLDGLELFLKAMIAFLLLVFMLLLFTSHIDKKREQLKIEVQQALVELNETLEERVASEVEKNREKDQQLLQQSRLASMGEMISMIAHQWRQPLNAISSTVQGLSLKLSLHKFDEEVFTCKLNDVNGYAQYLSQTIDDFRQFFKTSKEKNETTLEEVIERVLGIIRVSLESNSIALELEFHSHVTLLTHPNELMQVVLNLVKNAEDVLIDANIKNPWIKIRTAQTKRYLSIDVLDNGGGIPPEVIGRIFEPYYSTKTKKDGTGLGLYMSQKIVEEHCGGILRASNTETGAIFTVKLPRDEHKG